MAQDSMLDTSQNPTQSNSQRYIGTNNSVHYVGPKIVTTQLFEIQIQWNIMNVIKAKQKQMKINSNMADCGK